MPAYPEPEKPEDAGPHRSQNLNHPNSDDCRIRAIGLEIAHRPPGKQALWLRKSDGKLLTQEQALAMCDIRKQKKGGTGSATVY
jgi:hypothetical protein